MSDSIPSIKRPCVYRTGCNNAVNCNRAGHCTSADSQAMDVAEGKSQPREQPTSKERDWRAGCECNRVGLCFRCQAAEQIERLQHELRIWMDANNEWLKANGPGGWIDDLRLRAGHEPCLVRVPCSRGGMSVDDLNSLVDRLCHPHAPAPQPDDLYCAQVAILHLIKLMRTAQPPRAELQAAAFDLVDVLDAALIGAPDTGLRVRADNYLPVMSAITRVQDALSERAAPPGAARAEIQRWRDDALENAAKIAERYRAMDVARDIRAMCSTSTKAGE